MQTILLAGDLWSNLTNALANITTELISILPFISILVLVGCGLIMTLSQNLAEVAKRRIVYVIIGSVIVLGASTIVNWISNILVFS